MPRPRQVCINPSRLQSTRTRPTDQRQLAESKACPSNRQLYPPGPIRHQHGRPELFGLEQQEYSRPSIWQYQHCLARLGRMMERAGLHLADLDEVAALELIAQTQPPRGCNTKSGFVVKRFVRAMVDQGFAKAPPPPAPRDVACAELRREYQDYLRRQRGLSERTIADCWRFADRFLNFRFGEADISWDAITPGDVAAFLQRLFSRKTPYRDKTPPTHLRNFFQYLFKRGLTRGNLALCVPSVAQQPYDARLLRHLTPMQVEAVLAAVSAEEPYGRRNHAMVLLQARLGLRAPEVIAMRLDDIDWRAGELIVRGKARTTIVCRSRQTSAKPWRPISGTIAHRRHGRCSSRVARRTARSRTARSSTPSSKRRSPARE